MPIPVTVEEEEPEEEYQPHGDDIAGRVVLFKQTETAYCLFTYPKPEGD